MLFLLVLPIFLGVAAVHRYLVLYAPSNVLIRHIRMPQPCWRTVGALAAFAGVLLLALRAVEVVITAGAPGWLNLIALVLAWDAIKVGCVTAGVILRAVSVAGRRAMGRSSRSLQSAP